LSSVQGAARRHIAAQLSLASSSISTYWARIYDKLGFRSRSALIAWYRTEVARVQEAEVEVADSRGIGRFD
jgi:DNA-binding NarL/FixJ family response regulator